MPEKKDFVQLEKPAAEAPTKPASNDAAGQHAGGAGFMPHDKTASDERREDKAASDKQQAEATLAFYEEKLLAMAEALAEEKKHRPQIYPATTDGTGAIDFEQAEKTAPHVGKKHSRMCGSVIKAAFWLHKKNNDMVISAIFLQPQACLLGRVAADITTKVLVGENLAGVKLLRGLLRDLLQGKRDDMPKPFDGFNCFMAVRYLQNRHGAILLPVDVVIETWEKDLIKNA